jgi:hypothetical protein
VRSNGGCPPPATIEPLLSAQLDNRLTCEVAGHQQSHPISKEASSRSVDPSLSMPAASATPSLLLLPLFILQHSKMIVAAPPSFVRLLFSFVRITASQPTVVRQPRSCEDKQQMRGGTRKVYRSSLPVDWIAAAAGRDAAANLPEKFSINTVHNSSNGQRQNLSAF